MRKKNVKLTSPGKYTAQGPGWGPQLDSHNETTLGALEKPLPASRVQWLSRPGSKLPAAQGREGWVPSPWEKRSSIWGWGRALPLGAPLGPLPPVGRTQTDSSVGGWGGLAPQTLEGAQVHKTRTGLPAQRAGGGSGEERYSHTKATVNTTAWGGPGSGRKSSPSQVLCALGSPLPRSVGLALGSSMSLSRAPGGVGTGVGTGVGRGRAGRGWGERGVDRGSGEGATRTTPSWK